jgi:hypothetical protein
MRNTYEWSKTKFFEHRGAVAYIEVLDGNGDRHIGTSFHVGNGVYITARHVVENKEILEISSDNGHDPFTAIGDEKTRLLQIANDPLFHKNKDVDLACFTVTNPPEKYFELGGHLDCFLGNHELLLHKTLVMGFPRVPFAKRPHLIVSTGEINGLLEKYNCHQLAFVISTMARGGFSGGPVIVAYSEENTISGTALLGVVTESLIENHGIPESGFMAVTTIEPIYELLEQHNLLPEYQKLKLE